MEMIVTKFGQYALEELGRLHGLLIGVIGDESSLTQRLEKTYSEEKATALDRLRNIVAQYVSPGTNLDNLVHYDDEGPAIENAHYTEYLNHTLGEMCLCRVVDCYHWYLRKVVLLILERDSSLIRPWAKDLGIRNENEIRDFERGENRRLILISWFRGKEWRTRKLVHEYWNMPLAEDLDTLVKIRNCIVHQFGEDVDGRLEPLLLENNRLSIESDDGQIRVGFDGADSAISLVASDLSTIDQCLVRYFSLPAGQFRPPKLTRRLG